MTTYKIHLDGALWRIDAGGKSLAWFTDKHEAEAWLNAQAAQEDRGDILRELRAIHKTLCAIGVVLTIIWMTLTIGIVIDNHSPEPPQSTPPQETQQHGLDSDLPLVAAVASQGTRRGFT